MIRPHDLVVAHYHEVGLKGGNRSFFERTLAGNITRAVHADDLDRVKLISGRVLVFLKAGADAERVAAALRCIFGISSFSPAFEVEPQMQTLVDTAIAMARSDRFESFKVRARRGNSSFPETSQRVNEVVGQAIKDTTDARVDLDNGEWTCHIELVENRAFMYSTRVEGPGGLPVGTAGRVMALLSGGIDSPVAAWHIAKRGARVDYVHFHGQPFSDPSSVQQATRLARKLAGWTGESKLWLIPFGDIQSEIVTSAQQDLRIVLYRRFMMRIAESLSRREGVRALVTGESLGQVASQTLPNITSIGEVVQSMPILRPLIGFDKIEIEAVARRIGTYEISIEPHQDCCVLFVPRRVTTAAKPAEVKAAESDLDVEALVEKGVANASTVSL